ncbi:MAG TPA: glycosyltransferase [Noviherbaspirillum sp.]|nr:glycosyltransferase [Noviherbaspirillum sp.]
MDFKKQINALLSVVVENSGNDSPLPLSSWSPTALNCFSCLLLGRDDEFVELNDEFSISEAVHILYFKYLRRIADDGALARYANFKSIADVVVTCTNTLLASAEYQRSGRTPKHVRIEKAPGARPQILIDVTNTYTTGARTGIQRVVRELCSRLPRELKANLIYLNEKAYMHIDYANGDFVQPEDGGASREVIFRPGDIYFDMDASWGDAITKWDQYATLKKGGVRIVNVHYDAVPVLYPDYSHPTTVFRYLEHFVAAITFSDQFLCISHAVKNDLEKLIRRIGGRLPKMAVIPMGGNYAAPAKLSSSKVEDVLSFSRKRRFLLCVGTVEPRKNYSLLLRLLPRLRALDVSLIVVGKRGWERDDVLKSMDDASQSNSHFGWFSNIDDATLETLYSTCFAYLTTSFYEGYGLPVMEALSRKCIVISSDRGALPEAGNGLSLIFDPDNLDQVERIIERLATDKKYYQRQKARVQHYVAQDWNTCSNAIVQCMRPYFEHVNETAVKSMPLQLVYISISPENIRRSMQSFVRYAGVNRVLILTKSSLYQEMQSVIHDLNLSGVVLCDEDVLSEDMQKESDHQARNFSLRCALYARDEVDDIFIAADDDCILLRNLPEAFFISDNKFHARKSFPSMRDWKSSPFGCTSYDRGQWQSSKLLKSYGYSDAAYSAHQAQIFDKSIAGEIYKEFSSVGVRNLDEWSIYFNVAIQRYPNRFFSSAATTLYWPNEYNSWMPAWFCDDVYFENYYKSNYAEGGAAFAAGITVDVDWRIKLLHCKSQYQQYAFQNLLASLLSRESCALAQVQTAGDYGLHVTNAVITALSGLWFRVPVEGEDGASMILAYRITAGERLIIDGTQHPQQVDNHTGLMIKVPDQPGEFKLTIFSLSSASPAQVDVSVFVFPIKDIR